MYCTEFLLKKRIEKLGEGYTEPSSAIAGLYISLRLFCATTRVRDMNPFRYLPPPELRLR